jgi:8-oxo-dGTP pyrophosphatase MutT (NUDIX family)
VNPGPAPGLHLLPAEILRQELRRRLSGRRYADSDLRVGTVSRSSMERLRTLFPTQQTRAAVLIPLVDRGQELTVLLTHRSSELKHHAGQISFPGGRLEPGDDNAIAAALRETEEEIGLRREFIEVIGCLPDHVVISGYRVTPVVGLVSPGFELVLDPTEVSGTFEAPLSHLLNPATHTHRLQRFGGEELEVLELPWGGHTIWGATAGMLLTLREFLGGSPLHGD